MALADLIVVMNHGRIEQSGSPREVFNLPRTAFVAQFMGGHNVIATDRGKIAVRADRLKLFPASAPHARLAGTARGGGNPGPHVQGTIAAADPTELPATLDEAAFDAIALKPGEPVAIDWNDNDIH